ncbi:MAG: TonB-dependent receptor [Gammaproteobacteria bacterium]|nr:MAG: TonB-dependent receptor [Gammaproteobacteria bacterium]
MKKQLHGSRSLMASFVASALALAAGTPDVTWAQESGATLQGKAEADSEVTAKNVDTGLTRHTKAGSDGTYIIVGLPAGTYNVDAGPGTQQTVTLNVATTDVLDLEKIATVTVSGTAQRLAEVRTSEIGTIVSQQQIETVPQLTRNFLEFADTVPGMQFKVDAAGNSSLQGGAQNASSVNVYIDGVGQKNYVKEGGVSGQFFTQGNPFPQLAIGEYKVITSNYKAEYDQISSAAVTAETKSGTNKFAGQVFGTYTGTNFRAETPSELNVNRKIPSKDKEFGFAFGGPIIQNVMHFFVTYEGKRYTTPIAITPGSLAPPNIVAQLPPSARAEIGPADKSFDENLYFGKLDWEPTTDDRFVLTAKVRREDQSGDNPGFIAPSASIDVLNHDTRIDARWERSADRWFNEVLVTYEDSFESPTARAFGNGAQYTFLLAPGNDQPVLTTGPATPGATQNKGQKGYSVGDELTFSHLQWWIGDHTVKTGIKYKWVKLTAQDAENINPQFFYDVSATGTAPIPYKVFFTDPVPGLNPVATSDNKQFGIYLQDDWATTDKLTLNVGVRWDYERTPSYLDYVTPANVVAALNGPNPSPLTPGQTYAQALALGGVNVNDYISNGHNRSAYATEIQPRLGFSYDLQADQRHVIFGGVGRSYDRDLFDYLQLEETKQALPQFTINFNRPPDHPCMASPTCVAWDPKYLTGLSNLQALVAASNLGAEVDLLNNNLKVPYSDQFSLGIRNRVGDWNTSVSLARILSYDGFVFSLGNRHPNGAFFVNGGNQFQNPVPGFGSLIIGNNGIKTRNTELLLSAEKPFTPASHWGATIAYTYTSASQNRDLFQHYAFDEATIGQYLFIASNAVPKHRLVMSGSVGIPWDVIIAAKFTVETPTPDDDFTCLDTTPPYFPTGSNCQPFAVTPPGLGYRSFDMEVTKNFDVRNVSTLSVRVDVLNLFNVKNYNDYTLGGDNGVVNHTSVAYNPIGNIVGVPRTLRMTLNATF